MRTRLVRAFVAPGLAWFEVSLAPRLALWPWLGRIARIRVLARFPRFERTAFASFAALARGLKSTAFIRPRFVLVPGTRSGGAWGFPANGGTFGVLRRKDVQLRFRCGFPSIAGLECFRRRAGGSREPAGRGNVGLFHGVE